MSEVQNIHFDRSRQKAAWISAGVSLLVFIIKVYGYSITQSAAVLSDALESIVNVVASIVALIVIRYVEQPADREHPYGHGKAEYFSAAVEGGLVFFASLTIILEGSMALIHLRPLNRLDEGLYIMLVAALVNLVLGLYLKRVGKKENSEALQVSAIHILSDVWTTAGVIIGLLLVMITRVLWIDALIAIVIGLQLGIAGYRILRRSLNALIDGADETILDELVQSLNKNRREGIIDIHHLRTIRSGRFHHVDAHLVVPENWDISKVHHWVHEYEREVVKDYKFEGEIAFHLDPCKRKYCEMCNVEKCEIRQKAFLQKHPFVVSEAIEGPRYD
ncbi:MAG TPA: cation diffusion facilitator family transporter [Pseudobdellovibrionaceae bacterium]|nr:cation diffusion facilitator family transporter [Pseudobdellovibrionaceae bacterium]